MKEYIITEHPLFPYEEPKPQELIRCKDCKYWWESAQMCTIAELPTGSSCSAEDYCSKAERKKA